MKLIRANSSAKRDIGLSTLKMLRGLLLRAHGLAQHVSVAAANARQSESTYAMMHNWLILLYDVKDIRTH